MLYFLRPACTALLLATFISACASSGPSKAVLEPWERESSDLRSQQKTLTAQFGELEHKVMVLEERQTIQQSVSKFSPSATNEESQVMNEESLPQEVVVLQPKVRSRPVQRTVDRRPSKVAVARQYNQLFEKFNKGDCQETVLEFDRFAKANQRSTYADNAQYWIGECYFRMREYELAIGEFKKVPEIYPTGNKVPDAYLRIGMAQSALGNGNDAKTTYERLLANFPDTEAAQKARSQLQHLRPEGGT